MLRWVASLSILVVAGCATGPCPGSIKGDTYALHFDRPDGGACAHAPHDATVTMGEDMTLIGWAGCTLGPVVVGSTLCDWSGTVECGPEHLSEKLALDEHGDISGTIAISGDCAETIGVAGTKE
jgi:hypothetical protein